MTYTVGIDVGGTFTDCVVVDGDGRVWMDKAFTTPDDLARGITDALANTCSHLDGVTVEQVLADAQLFGVGTTSLINRVVSRRGAKVGFITTRGHEDAVQIGRVLSRSEGLPEQAHYDVAAWNKPELLFEPGAVRGVSERIDSAGDVIAPLNEGELRTAAQELVDAGVDSIAIVFLWSFLNPVHEQRAREIVAEIAPDLPVNISSEIAPTLGELERANTTLLNAYLAPGAVHDFAAIEQRLKDRGLAPRLLMMQSNGGLAWASELQHRPVSGLAAGPVGGVVGAQKLAAATGAANVVCTDMGGTSFDVGLIVGGEPLFSAESVVERHRIRIPSVEVTSIGAGGGSIASVDELTGELHVGPRSAGSTPGPVCYGNGGTEPTVTDANVVLGRIDPGSFWSGRRQLDRDAALAAITEKVAKPLGLDPLAAAAGIIDIVDARMADLLRTMTIATGHDPRDFVLYAYGGAGPVHVGAYARQLGVSQVVVPMYAPVLSAFGIATGDFRRHLTRAQPMTEPYEPAQVQATLASMRAQAEGDWADAGQDPAQASYGFSVDMRFRYQVHEIRVPVEESDSPEQLIDRFVALYEQTFGAGTALRAAGTEMLTFHLISSLPAAVRDLARSAGSPGGQAQSGTRDVYFDGAMHPTPVYRFGDLGGQTVQGPAIIEAPNTTVVMHPGQSARLDDLANLVVST